MKRILLIMCALMGCQKKSAIEKSNRIIHLNGPQQYAFIGGNGAVPVSVDWDEGNKYTFSNAQHHRVIGFRSDGVVVWREEKRDSGGVIIGGVFIPICKGGKGG